MLTKGINNKAFIFFFAVLLASFQACQTSDVRKDAGLIKWRTLAEGRAEAMERNMPCLVDFYYGAGCPRCVLLEEKVYSDTATAERINSSFIPVRIDLAKALTDEEKKLAERMETGGECMLLFLHASGEPVTTTKGVHICTMDMISPEQFNGYLDAALENISGK